MLVLHVHMYTSLRVLHANAGSKLRMGQAKVFCTAMNNAVLMVCNIAIQKQNLKNTLFCRAQNNA